MPIAIEAASSVRELLGRLVICQRVAMGQEEEELALVVAANATALLSSVEAPIRTTMVALASASEVATVPTPNGAPTTPTSSGSPTCTSTNSTTLILTRYTKTPQTKHNTYCIFSFVIFYNLGRGRA